MASKSIPIACRSKGAIMAGPLDSCRRTGPDIADLARRLYDEVWNAAHYEVADELFHRDFAYFAAPGLRGPEAKLAAIRRYRSSCPDLHIHIDEMIVQGDRVAVRWTLTGTDTGGLAGRPPTGRSIAAWGVDILGEVVPVFVELEVAVPRLMPASR